MTTFANDFGGNIKRQPFEQNNLVKKACFDAEKWLDLFANWGRLKSFSDIVTIFIGIWTNHVHELTGRVHHLKLSA